MVDSGDRVYELMGRGAVHDHAGRVFQGDPQSFGLYSTEAAANGRGVKLMEQEIILSWSVDKRIVRDGAPSGT